MSLVEKMARAASPLTDKGWEARDFLEYCEGDIVDMRRAMKALSDAGFAVVPKELTEEMDNALTFYVDLEALLGSESEWAQRLYAELLAAAPEVT